VTLQLTAPAFRKAGYWHGIWATL